MTSQVIRELIKKKITISTAESCTGGLLASKITSISNASNIFNLGLVTYSNSAKHKILKINPKTLKKYGAVSQQVCKEMVQNLFKLSKSKISISVTGIAGPNGGTNLKPVGTVYVGVKYNKKIKIYLFNFNQKFSRNKIQNLTVVSIFQIIKGLI